MSRTNHFDREFGAFLAAWARHEDLRKTPELPALFNSRRQLDDLRYRVWVAAHTPR